jgi:hypothetical protein
VYLARLIPFHDIGIGTYYAFVVGMSIMLGLAARCLGRKHELDPLLIGLGTIVLLLAVDVVALGSTLQFNSGFGSSPEVAGRFTGFGNSSYAVLAAAAVLLAGLLAHRVGGRRGSQVAVAVLVAAVVVDGAPFWGADVGGLLSMVPAFGVTAILLTGRKVRLRGAVAFAGITIGALVAAATVDSLRPADQRTHLGRLVEQVRGEGSSAFTSVVRRKLEMNISSLSTANWRFLVPIVLAFVTYLVFWPPRRLNALLQRIPELRSALIGFATLLVLGYALNDSGIVVPAIMLGVLNAVLVSLTVPERAT